MRPKEGFATVGTGRFHEARLRRTDELLAVLAHGFRLARVAPALLQEAVLGGTGKRLNATASEDGDEVTVRVEGQAPRLFSLPLLVPAVRASASLPLERYPTAEAAP